MPRLLNPRGRIIEVEEKDVSALLKRGFSYPPEDQGTSDYNPVFDKGTDAPREPAPPQEAEKIEDIKRLGGTLNAEKI